MADLRGREGRAPPKVQILSILCSFWEILVKSYVGAPPPGGWRPDVGEILDPPLIVIVDHSFSTEFQVVYVIKTLIDPAKGKSKYEKSCTHLKSRFYIAEAPYYLQKPYLVEKHAENTVDLILRLHRIDP